LFELLLLPDECLGCCVLSLLTQRPENPYNSEEEDRTREKIDLSDSPAKILQPWRQVISLSSAGALQLFGTSRGSELHQYFISESKPDLRVFVLYNNRESSVNGMCWQSRRTWQLWFQVPDLLLTHWRN